MVQHTVAKGSSAPLLWGASHEDVCQGESDDPRGLSQGGGVVQGAVQIIAR